MMAERGDFVAVHEPFSRAEVFGEVDVGGRGVGTVPEAIEGLRDLAATESVFVKETTDRRFPDVLADRRFLAEDARHTFLIRHPRETIRSYLALRPGAASHEIGFEAQYEMYTEVRRVTGRDPLIVDAGDLMDRPADTIKAYCAHVGIDFRPEALTWQPSDRVDWRQFGRWHTAAAASSGLAQTPGRDDTDDDTDEDTDAERHPMLDTYLAYHLPFYQRLYRRRLRVQECRNQ